MFQVFHKIDSDFGFDDADAQSFPEGFEKVAEVDTNSLEDVYHFTNHIDTAWWENPRVTLVKESRSTSVGDVAIKDNGVRFICRRLGWEKF